MKLAQHVANAAIALLDLLLPTVCAACGRPVMARETGPICGRCWARLELLPHPRCERCGHPRTQDAECRWCTLLPPYIRAARSVCVATSGSGPSILAALKYEGWTAAADTMGERMARLSWPPDVLEERAALVPVPLSAVRRRARGYNQSELLAQAIGARWNLPVWTTLVVRSGATVSQTRLGPEERRRNVHGAFRVAPGSINFRGAHLVLVDDVITTGATLNECAAALYGAGARILSYVTFARAPARGDRW